MIKNKMQLDSFILILFVAGVIIISIFTFNLRGVSVSMDEKRVLKSFPIQIVDGHIEGLNRVDIEDWINDNIGLRDSYIAIQKVIETDILRMGYENVVIVDEGREGWFFSKVYRDLDIAYGTYEVTDEMLHDFCRTQEKIRDRLKTQGIDYILVVVPDKVSIYPEHIDCVDVGVEDTPIDKLEDYFNSHSDIKIVVLKDVLLSAKTDEDVFYHIDALHWNTYGQFVGYREIMRKMAGWGYDVKGDVKIRRYFGEWEGGETLNMVAVANPLSSIDERGDLVVHINTSVNNNIRMLGFGNSQFYTGIMSDLFGEECKEYAYVWNESIMQDYIDEYKPNVIVLEIIEAKLNQYGDWLYPDD